MGCRERRFIVERMRDAARRPIHVEGKRWPTPISASSMLRGKNEPNGSSLGGISTMRTLIHADVEKITDIVEGGL
jgi:hypothetical protein